MSNRLFVGLLAAGFALSVSEACNHAGGNGSTGTAGTGSTGTGNGSGQAGTGSGTPARRAAPERFGDTGTAGTATGHRQQRRYGRDERRRRHERRRGHDRRGRQRQLARDDRQPGRQRPPDHRGERPPGTVALVQRLERRQHPAAARHRLRGDRGRREQHRLRGAHDGQRLPVRRRRLRSQQRRRRRPNRCRAWRTTPARSTASRSGRRAAARCASSSRCGRSSRPTAAGRAPATAGTCTAPTRRR